MSNILDSKSWFSIQIEIELFNEIKIENNHRNWIGKFKFKMNWNFGKNEKKSRKARNHQISIKIFYSKFDQSEKAQNSKFMYYIIKCNQYNAFSILPLTLHHPGSVLIHTDTTTIANGLSKFKMGCFIGVISFTV